MKKSLGFCECYSKRQKSKNMPTRVKPNTICNNDGLGKMDNNRNRPAFCIGNCGTPMCRIFQ